MWLSRTLGTAVVRVLIDAAFAAPWTRWGIYGYRHCLAAHDMGFLSLNSELYPKREPSTPVPPALQAPNALSATTCQP
jgi:hypothetical protein